MKYFNTAGPIIPASHYYIPRRLNWDQLDGFLEKGYYFILHAPRQSGKTSAIIEYVHQVNKIGKYTALYLTTEPAHTARNDVTKALYWLLLQLKVEIGDQLGKENQPKALQFLENALAKNPVDAGALYLFLHYWSQENGKPIVLFFDEIDGLVESSLISLLKQLRTGYTKRPRLFPQSVCLIGVRNLQDYKLQSIDDIERGILLSPFNIVSDALLLRNFTLEQVKELYNQHTTATGQIFTPDAIELAYCLTQGQPWLANAIAYQACFRDVTDRSKPITEEVIERAKEELIFRRDTHINALLDRLNEPRVKNVIDAIISGTSEQLSFNPDDIQYVRDLGLLKEDSWEIANPIYQQVIPRELTYIVQSLIPNKQAWYINQSGQLDINKLLQAFVEFFKENAESYSAKMPYYESFPHLLLMAFLQRIVNGGGKIHREYALGRKRVDLLVEWKAHRYLLELKIRRGEDTMTKGLEQIAEYMDKCSVKEGHLLIFDRDPKKTWDQKISNEQILFNGKNVHVWTL